MRFDLFFLKNGEGQEMRAAQGATKSRSEAYVRTPQRRDEEATPRCDAYRAPQTIAHVAQSVERVLGKDEVSGSIPLVGSIFPGVLNARDNARGRS